MMQQNIPAKIIFFKKYAVGSLRAKSKTYPEPGEYGDVIDPITASEAIVAIKGSDSNHCDKIL